MGTDRTGQEGRTAETKGRRTLSRGETREHARVIGLVAKMSRGSELLWWVGCRASVECP